VCLILNPRVLSLAVPCLTSHPIRCSLRNEIKRLRDETRSHRLDAAQRVLGTAALSTSSVGKLRSTVAAAQPAAALLPPRSPVNFDP